MCRLKSPFQFINLPLREIGANTHASLIARRANTGTRYKTKDRNFMNAI
jgi:hypothetical protein